MTDTSKNMLWHAMQKHDMNTTSLPVKFCLADAQQMLSHSDAPSTAISDASESSVYDKISTTQNLPQAPRYQEKLETFSPAQFDTVVDTFGLCSHEDPKAALMVQFSPTSCLLIILQCAYCSNGALQVVLHRMFTPYDRTCI